jgi:hypothetical protein
MVLELLTTGHKKKVFEAKEAVERIIAEEKVVPRKALKARTGVSDAELSRCLKELEEEGKLVRRVDTKDGRKTVCVHVGASSSLSYDEEQLLAVIHGNPDLAYRELEEASGFDCPKDFPAAYYKLLSLGRVGEVAAGGRLYAVITPEGLRRLQGAEN